MLFKRIGVHNITLQDLLDGNSAVRKSLVMFDEVIIDESAFEFMLSISSLPPLDAKAASEVHKIKNGLRQLAEYADKGVIKIERNWHDTEDLSKIKIKDGLHEDLESLKHAHNGFLNKPQLPVYSLAEYMLNNVDFIIRLLCSFSNRFEKDLYIPIVSNFTNDSSASTIEADTYNLLLTHIPVPSQNVRWEQLAEIKADTHLKAQYEALIKWVNDIATEKHSLKDIELSFNAVYSSYIKALEVHQLEYQQSVSLVVLTNVGLALAPLLAAKFVPGLEPLGLSSIILPYFQIRKARTDLLKSELTILGRELAYIHNIKNKITGKSKS